MSMLKGIAEVKRYFLPGMPVPNVIREMQCNRWGQEMTWQAFAILVLFLRKSLMAKETIPLCDYSFYSHDKNDSGGRNMIIDCQAGLHVTAHTLHYILNHIYYILHIIYHITYII